MAPPTELNTHSLLQFYLYVANLAQKAFEQTTSLWVSMFLRRCNETHLCRDLEFPSTIKCNIASSHLQVIFRSHVSPLKFKSHVILKPTNYVSFRNVHIIPLQLYFIGKQFQ